MFDPRNPFFASNTHAQSLRVNIHLRSLTVFLYTDSDPDPGTDICPKMGTVIMGNGLKSESEFSTVQSSHWVWSPNPSWCPYPCPVI